MSCSKSHFNFPLVCCNSKRNYFNPIVEPTCQITLPFHNYYSVAHIEDFNQPFILRKLPSY